MKRWIVLNKEQLPIREKLLANRKIKNSDLFFKPHLYKLTSPDKFFDDLDKAASRVKKAIRENELIFIYGDFDVDGITAVAILWETINFLGGKVLPYIPHRETEGYGVHASVIEKLAKEGAKVIITVDCGITAVKEAETAAKLGIDLIITDHHIKQDQIPASFALLHTTRLSGSGVAFLFAKVLLEEFGYVKNDQFFKNLELAALGTIADMVPLIDDNRIIVANGLHNLAHTERFGLKALYEEAAITKKIGTCELGFVISPWLNSMGRMEHALDSLRLLLTRDKERAKKLAKQLSLTNRERQMILNRNLEHAIGVIDKQSETKMLVVEDSSYAPGVIGLVASRLVDKFYKPAVVIAQAPEISKGSARSIEGLNITQFLSDHSDLLKNFGGHPMAAGFSIASKKIAAFKERIINQAEKVLKSSDLIPTLTIESWINFDQLNTETVNTLEEFEPFGVGNREPIFALRNLEIRNIKPVGNGKHLKFIFRRGIRLIDGIWFQADNFSSEVGSIVDVAFSLEKNNWMGETRIQLKIRDIRLSEEG